MTNFPTSLSFIIRGFLQLLILVVIVPYQVAAEKANTSIDSKVSENLNLERKDTGRSYMSVEICDNRRDDDGDGLIDCLDPDCASYTSCWTCDSDFYQVHSNTTIVALDPTDGTYEVRAKISGAEQINGAQFNHIDGHVYAPTVIDGKQVLSMLNADGSVTSLGLELPGSIFYCGSISKEGVMYLSNGSGIHYIDLNSKKLSLVDTGLPHAGVADFSLDINRGLFYGISGSKKLVVFDPYSLELKQYDLAGTINNDSGGFGATWSSKDGSFFAYNNSSGKIYSVDVTNLTATEVLNATGNLSINDGFNCIEALPPFETYCDNGIDDDGDGLIDCEDPDCYNSNSCTVEICDNGIDDDLDGWADCDDSECFALAVCLEICDNGIDDNGNGLVDGDDPQCGTSGGVTGGLESNRRLSDKIALRNFYTKVKDPQAFIEKNEGLIPFTDKALKNSEDIGQYIPSGIEDLYMAESSPQDLVNITNASQVIGADYYYGDQRVASVLGLLSTEGVYEHTKYICDRVDGSRLLDISYLSAYDGNFISYELLNKFGQQEYAVSFAGYLDTDGKFNIENHWNLHNYSKKRDYYNFQIWANSYDKLIQLLESTLSKMEANNGIASIVHTSIPRVFVTYGTYNNGNLRLVIKNKNRTKFLRFSSKLRRIENGELEEYNEDVLLNEEGQQVITLNTGHFYDIGASLKFDGLVNDEIFLADGAWGVDDQNPGARVNNFDVAVSEVEYDQEVYEIERSINLDAEVKDYLNVYRALDAKLNPRNISEFNSLAFEVNGTGMLEVTIVKESITEWENQFRTKFNLSEHSKEIVLKTSEFKSKLIEDLSLEDVTMVVFTLLGDQDNHSTKKLMLDALRFQNSFTTSIPVVPNKIDAEVYPNPVKDYTTVQFDAERTGEAKINILDSSGRKVISQRETIRLGSNKVKIDMTSLHEGIYYFEIFNNDLKVSQGKLIRLD